MGSPRPRPKLLAAKLLTIRQSLGLSQNKLVKRMGVEDLIHYTNISKYEYGKNEPPLVILLAYSRVVGIQVESLIDDSVSVDAFEFLID
ncbi:MAG TPA: helix-turn-helix transcriptional regulator [Pyrinomonadaceae bacterium]|nr:helix-turn-helix transcriptional regulator [Pyrinomonadaceae bacterium]